MKITNIWVATTQYLIIYKVEPVGEVKKKHTTSPSISRFQWPTWIPSWTWKFRLPFPFGSLWKNWWHFPPHVTDPLGYHHPKSFHQNCRPETERQKTAPLTKSKRVCERKYWVSLKRTTTTTTTTTTTNGNPTDQLTLGSQGTYKWHHQWQEHHCSFLAFFFVLGTMNCRSMRWPYHGDSCERKNIFMLLLNNQTNHSCSLTFQWIFLGFQDSMWHSLSWSYVIYVFSDNKTIKPCVSIEKTSQILLKHHSKWHIKIHVFWPAGGGRHPLRQTVAPVVAKSSTDARNLPWQMS